MCEWVLRCGRGFTTHASLAQRLWRRRQETWQRSLSHRHRRRQRLRSWRAERRRRRAAPPPPPPPASTEADRTRPQALSHLLVPRQVQPGSSPALPDRLPQHLPKQLRRDVGRFHRGVSHRGSRSRRRLRGSVPGDPHLRPRRQPRRLRRHGQRRAAPARPAGSGRGSFASMRL